MRQILSSAEFWKFALPLLGAVIAWFVNEWRKRLSEQFERKEASYKQLVQSLKGFYIGAAEADRLKAEFLDQMNQCWLYCSDEVIKKGYAFLETVHTQKQVSDETKEKALGDFVACIRRDLISRKLLRKTSLSGTDFRHLKVNK